MSDAPAPDSKVDSQLLIPKRRIWPVLLVLAMIAGAAGFLVLRSLREPAPLRVLVAIDLDGYWWEGSKPAAALADALAERLAKIGFEPVLGGDPEVAATLEKARSPEEAARKLRAAFVVTAHLKPQIQEHPVDGGYFEVRIDAPIEVRHIDDDPGQPGRLVAWSGAKQKPEALRLVARSLANMAFDEILPRLTGHPSIQALFEGSNVKLAGQVTPAKQYVAFRDKKIAEAAEGYARMAKARQDGAQDPEKVTYHGPMSAQDGLGGTGADGFLVKTADVTPFVSPTSMDLTWITRLETVVWRSPEGKERPLWSGYHIFSYPSVAPEGAPVIFVEDLFGWAKTLTVVDADGKARRLRVDATHRFVDPKLAPGGKAAALYDRPCRDCAGGLLIVATDDGRALFEKTPGGEPKKAPGGEPKEAQAEEQVDDAQGSDTGEFSGFTWIDASRLAFLYTPAPPPDSASAPRQELWIADLSREPATASAVHTAPEGDTYGTPAASRDGRLIALELRSVLGDRLAIYDVAAGKVTAYETRSRAYTPAFSPDGGRVAFSQGGNIVLLTLAGGQLRALTTNAYLERYPAFSSDGKRLYFESIDSDPVFPRRNVAVVASVAVPP